MDGDVAVVVKIEHEHLDQAFADETEIHHPLVAFTANGSDGADRVVDGGSDLLGGVAVSSGAVGDFHTPIVYDKTYCVKHYPRATRTGLASQQEVTLTPKSRVPVGTCHGPQRAAPTVARRFRCEEARAARQATQQGIFVALTREEGSRTDSIST